MKTLLSEIAEYYVNRYGREIIDFCFIFPNKRAGVFFSHFIDIASTRLGFPLIHPEVTTISDMVSELTDGIEASRIEQLFILYRCYREIIQEERADGEESVDFNKFQYWGEVLLNDFTDVDKYLVDPAELFHNIESLKEISANYLTPEQIDIIKRYWGEEKVPPQIADFWNHAVHVNDQAAPGQRPSTAAFIKLWQVMYKLYVRYNAELDSRGLTYQGRMYKDALNVVKKTPREDFPYTKYIFIGFNVLSTVEEKIFEAFKTKGLADFFWDFASPTFNDVSNRATRFLKNYVTSFPQPDDATGIGKKLEVYPEIEVIGVPSVSGQTKIVGEIINNLIPAESGGQQDSLLSTAIVLPDETLCTATINSLPGHITDINITMGYPMCNTPVASLINLVIAMQMRARKHVTKDTFFHEDITAVLSHPLIRSISSSTCDAIGKYIRENRLYNIEREALLNNEFKDLSPLFGIVKDTNSEQEVFAFMRRLLHWLLDEVNIRYRIEDADEIESDEEKPVCLTAAGAIEAGFLKHYLAAIDELEYLRIKHLTDLDVELNDGTIFHLVERLISGESVAFEGQPLKGLQVMGLLETRVLDFDNVIIMSMNERIFPRKHFSRSLIPAALRLGYGMATIDHQESLSAYYFYRLITRAKKVYLVYDSRTQGLKSGEQSRYINQLRYIYAPPKLKISNAYYNLHVEESQVLQLEMTPMRQALVDRYTSVDNPAYISATSINKFISCPLSFALSYLEGYYDDADKNNYFDEATLGSVIHQVVERLYSSRQRNGHPALINRAVINTLKREDVIMPELWKAINRHYLKRDEDDLRKIPADARLLARIMYQLIVNMLEHELDSYDEFEFLSGERKHRHRLRISPDLELNFSYTIDRVDRVTAPDGTKIIRIIDYKTGGDKVASKIENLFDPDSYGTVNKAILQLYLYCNAFAQNEIKDENIKIQPVIYSFRTIGQNLAPESIKIEGNVINDFRQIITIKKTGEEFSANDEILSELAHRLKPLFDHEAHEPFVFKAAENEHACKYCQFISICGR